MRFLWACRQMALHYTTLGSSHRGQTQGFKVNVISNARQPVKKVKEIQGGERLFLLLSGEDALGGDGSCGQGRGSSGAATDFSFRDRAIRASDGDA